jgi:aspartyl-tRNA(Asn)/glutamyl-tRNA(Gln) amidotransferase subunit A
VLDGVGLPVRANLGIYTQIIAAPWHEDVALRIAHALEQAGIAAASRPSLEATA